MGERSGYSPKHEPAKQRYTVQSMECSLCAKVSEAQAVFFHSVQGCHNLLLRDSNRRRKVAPKNNNNNKTDDVQLFSSAGFICFPFTFIETGLFCGSLFESWLVTHSKLWAIGRKY